MISSVTSLSLQTSSIKYLLKILILLDLLLVLKNCKSLPKLILVVVVLLSLLISLRVAQILSLTLLPALMSTIRHFLLINTTSCFCPSSPYCYPLAYCPLIPLHYPYTLLFPPSYRPYRPCPIFPSPIPSPPHYPLPLISSFS